MALSMHNKTKWESRAPADQYMKGLMGIALLTIVVTLFTKSIVPTMFCAAALAFMLVSLFMSGHLWYQKLCALVLRAQVVELLDYDGKRSYTIVYTHRDDQHRWVAPVDWFTQTGQVLLNPDGTVDASSGSSYVKYWRPMDPELRMAQVLTYGIPQGFLDRE
jgi:hypothetical protein